MNDKPKLSAELEVAKTARFFAAFQRDFRDVQQAFQTRFEFHEYAEVGDLRDMADLTTMPGR